MIIKSKTDEELELELKKQTLRAKFYFLAVAIALIVLVSAYKFIKNFQANKPAEESSPANTENGEGVVLPSEQGNEQNSPSESQSLPESDGEEYYSSPDDSSNDSGPVIIEESDPGDYGSQEEIVEY